MHKFQYIDSANNLYEISELALSYHPTKPEMSSSGEYDGGEEQQILLTEDNFSSLLQLLDHALQHTEDHIEQRKMGSGLLKKFTTENEFSSCILAYKSPAQKQIQEQLEQLIER